MGWKSKVAKTSRKPSKNTFKNQKVEPYVMIGFGSFVFCFCWFAQGFCLFSAQRSTNVEKTKSQKSLALCAHWVWQFCVFLFLVFSRLFFWLPTQSSKTSRKPTIKTKSSALYPLGLAVVFFCFCFWFSQGVLKVFCPK